MQKGMLKIEGIAKSYRKGTGGSGRLREDFRQWWHGKNMNGDSSTSQLIWALKDVNFEVEEGDVLGIVGNNGAGKSTLLKIISRITQPTQGIVKGNGRIASLLEVGTGFHGELTGRENIFLNGHILGMKKEEINQQFDEIVHFSGIETFIDTPVKRYSSGMYMRLAFAVAAHLNPEILIVDEVLAVGDADFQKKCIGKMKEVSTQKGRTILFVSHNMTALQNLCNKAIAMDQGRLVNEGDPATVIASYLKADKHSRLFQHYETDKAAPGNDYIKIKTVALKPGYLSGDKVIDIRTPLHFEIDFHRTTPINGTLTVGIHLFTDRGDFIFDVCSDPIPDDGEFVKARCTIPGNFLNDGAYFLSVVFVKDTTTRLFYYENCISFEVEDYRANTAWYGKWAGLVRPSFPVIISTTPPSGTV